MPDPKRLAVVIGINYDNLAPGLPAEAATRAGLTPLRFAEADAHEMAAALQAAGFAVETLLGAAATRAAIIGALRKQALAFGSAGLLVAYFAGHGDVDPNNDTLAYLLPADADPDALDVTAIPLEDLAGRYLGRVGTALTLLDCCHSGYAVGVRGHAQPADSAEQATKFRRQAQTTFGNYQGRMVLAACSGDQKARELAALGHGAFTYYALDHLAHSAEVTEGSLYDYVAAALDRQGLPAPVRGGFLQGRLLLRAAEAGGPAPSAPPVVANAPAPALTAKERQDLYTLLATPLTDARLADVCFALAVDPATLSSGDLVAKFRQLIRAMEHAGRVGELQQVAPAPAPVAPTPPGDSPAAPTTDGGQLSRQDYALLQEALLAAFPGLGPLTQMVRFGLDQNLTAIAGGGNLREMVFNLIGWAEAESRIPDLLKAATEANPTNANLRQVVTHLRQP